MKMSQEKTTKRKKKKKKKEGEEEDEIFHKLQWTHKYRGRRVGGWGEGGRRSTQSGLRKGRKLCEDVLRCKPQGVERR